MRLTDLLALSNVPRWSITAHQGSQTVSDHTFRVLAIALELGARVGVELSLSDFIRILCHDGHESWTADIPSPIKREMEEAGIDFNKAVPWMKGVPKFSGPNQQLVFEVADKIEAYTFIGTRGIGEQAKRIATGCLQTIRDKTSNPPPGVAKQNWERAVGSVILDVMEERGRGWGPGQESK